MANLIDYIQWRGDLDFSQSSLNPVDNLVFSELAYMKFSEVLEKRSGITIANLWKCYSEDYIDKGMGVLLKGDYRTMLQLMGASKRFGNLVIRESVDINDESIQTQFAATIIEIDRKTAFYAFRGTDDSLVGWKEDLQMSYMDRVPAQKSALDFLQGTMNRYHYKRVYIGGHSKGGNLAVYAAIQSEESTKKAIVTIYNNDGPGFKESIVDTKEYQSLKNRIVTLVPQSSVVGMLLEHSENYHIVKSGRRGIFQHDGFSWETLGPDFIYLTELTRDARLLDKTAKKMLEQMSLEERETFATVLFDLLSVNESKTLTELSERGLSSLFKMSENYLKLDTKTKKVILEPLSLFISESCKTIFEGAELNLWRNKYKIWKKKTKKGE